MHQNGQSWKIDHPKILAALLSNIERQYKTKVRSFRKRTGLSTVFGNGTRDEASRVWGQEKEKELKLVSLALHFYSTLS